MIQQKAPRRSPETALWRAVILQALLDCLSQSKKKANVQAREEAIEWLNPQNNEFKAICSFAQLEPDYVFKKAIHAFKNQHLWRRKCDIGKGAQFFEESQN